MNQYTIATPLKRPFALQAALVCGASLFLGLLAKIQIPLVPVPIVLQDSMALFMGVLLGRKRGSAAVFLFLLQAALGCPVLAGGVGGLAKFIGPTGGYLLGYFFGAWTAGWVREKLEKKTVFASLFGMLAGSAVLFFCGLSYLGSLIGLKPALIVGFLPFIPGNLLKTLACVRLYKVFKNL